MVVPERGQVLLDELDRNACDAGAAPSLHQGRRCEVHADHLETALGEVNGVRARSTTEVDRAAWATPTRFDEVDELAARPELPGHAKITISNVVEGTCGHAHRPSSGPTYTPYTI